MELFVDLVRAINTRAERRVDKEQIAEFRRVGDKEDVLFTLADVSLAHPDEVVRQVVFPAVGEQTLKDLVAEARATDSRRRTRVLTVLTGLYSHYYRVMLPKLLDALEFRCDNSAYRPVMDAVELLHRYKDRDGRFTHYEHADRVPLDGVVKAEWRPAVVDERGRVERLSFELCVLGALRDALRRREIWVVGAKVWRNPEADLPVDFDLHREVHYAAIAQPSDSREFVSSLRTRGTRRWRPPSWARYSRTCRQPAKPAPTTTISRSEDRLFSEAPLRQKCVVSFARQVRATAHSRIAVRCRSQEE